jgi:hypothetical protein
VRFQDDHQQPFVTNWPQLAQLAFVEVGCVARAVHLCLAQPSAASVATTRAPGWRSQHPRQPGEAGPAAADRREPERRGTRPPAGANAPLADAGERAGAAGVSACVLPEGCRARFVRSPRRRVSLARVSCALCADRRQRRHSLARLRCRSSRSSRRCSRSWLPSRTWRSPAWPAPWSPGCPTWRRRQRGGLGRIQTECCARSTWRTWVPASTSRRAPSPTGALATAGCAACCAVDACRQTLSRACGAGPGTPLQPVWPGHGGADRRRRWRHHSEGVGGVCVSRCSHAGVRAGPDGAACRQAVVCVLVAAGTAPPLLEEQGRQQKHRG